MAGNILAHEPGVQTPLTVSPQAREFLANATPFDLGRPSTAEEWQALRERISTAFDFTGILGKDFSFTAEQSPIGGVPTLVYTPSASNGDRVLMFLHGGAYVTGSPGTASGIVVPVSNHSGLPSIAVQYGLAPERPFPAGLNEALAVYRALLKEYEADSIGVYGSSSGAALAVAMLLKAHDEGLAMPSALGLVSPWSDLTETGDSYFTLRDFAPVLDYELTLNFAAGLYAGEYDQKLPLISPVYADFPADFPPTLIQVGTRDLFLSNSVRLYRKMRQGGVAVSLSPWEGMGHAFQMIPGLPEGQQARRELGEFMANPEAYFSPDR